MFFLVIFLTDCTMGFIHHHLVHNMFWHFCQASNRFANPSINAGTRTMGPSKPTWLEVFLVNNMVFRWPKALFFMVLGAHGKYTIHLQLPKGFPYRVLIPHIPWLARWS